MCKPSMIQKPQKNLLSFITLVIILLYSYSSYSQTDGYNYSVKNRWTVKASISRYKTALYNGSPIAHVGDHFLLSHNRKMINFKVESNYGINKFIETGIFTGFQHYEYYETTNQNTSSYEILGVANSFALLFGINLNFHILPFFVKSEKCRWDLYLTTKYGGCYLPYKEVDHPLFDVSKYRQEYGLGLGFGYYFKNIIGLFAEASIGQYFYFKRFKVAFAQDNYFEWVDFSDSNFSFRIGIAAKF